MPETVELVWDQFLGVDYRTDPRALARLENGKIVGKTNVSTNVYEKGGALIRRPGLGLIGPATGFPGAGYIYDMVAGSLTSATQETPDSVLFCLFNNAGTRNAGHYNPFLSNYVNYGALVPGDTSHLSRLVIAGTASVFITPGAIGVNWSRIVTAAGPNQYALGTYAADSAVQNYILAAWHRRTLFFLGGQQRATRANYIFSDFDVPLMPFPAANNNNTGTTGRLQNILGVYALGDLLFIGNGVYTYQQSGVLAEQFRLERAHFPFGVGGMRGMTNVNGKLAGFIPVSRFPSQGSEEKGYTNSFAVIGQDGSQAVIRDLDPFLGGAYDMNDSRAVFWTGEKTAFFFPGVTYGATGAVLYGFAFSENGGLWPLTYPANVNFNCLAEINGSLIVGCSDGLVRSFTAGFASDIQSSTIATPFQTTVATPPIPSPFAGRKYAIEYCEVEGRFLSQSAITAKLMNVYASSATTIGILGTVISSSSPSGNERLRFSFSGLSGSFQAPQADYYQQVLFDIGGASLSQPPAILSVLLGCKPMGRT